MAVPETKICSVCKEDKPRDEYSYRSKEKARLQSRCKACSVLVTKSHREQTYTKEQYAAFHKAYRRTESGAKASLKARCKFMGLSEEETNKVFEAFEASDGSCEICKTIPLGKPLFIDHCHDRLIFRGLLCHRCNTMIGFAKDNPDVLRAGATYVTER